MSLTQLIILRQWNKRSSAGSYFFMIDFISAKLIAEQRAKDNLSKYAKDRSQSFLAEDYLESDEAWLFFRAPDIVVPERYQFSAYWSYAVCKFDGELREFYELSTDHEMDQAFRELSNELRRKRN